jgi:hypothetical protein
MLLSPIIGTVFCEDVSTSRVGFVTVERNNERNLQFSRMDMLNNIKSELPGNKLQIARSQSLTSKKKSYAGLMNIPAIYMLRVRRKMYHHYSEKG